MPMFTVTELTRLLRECAGEDESVDLDGDIADTTFEDLGYDSLALFNTLSRIERDYDITLGDEVIAEAKTPQQLLTVVGELLSQQV